MGEVVATEVQKKDLKLIIQTLERCYCVYIGPSKKLCKRSC